MKSRARSIVRSLFFVATFASLAVVGWRSQGRQQCSYDIAPINQRFDAAGGAGTVTVRTAAGCAWTATGAPSWITLTSGASGSGNGSVMFTVVANPTRELRSATLMIAGRAFTVEQNGQGGNCVTLPILPDQTLNGTLAAGDCRPDNNPQAWADRYSFSGRAGELVIVTMTAATLSANLRLSGPGGAVLQNSDFASGTPRVARIPSNGLFTLPTTGDYLIQASTSNANETGDYTLNLTLVGVGCDSFTLVPGEQSFDINGGAGSLQVATNNGCAWTATSPVPWVTFTSGAAGSGSLPVRFSVAANMGAYRVVNLTIAGQSYRVEQAGVGGVCSPIPLANGQTVQDSFTNADCRSRFRPSFGSNLTDRNFAKRYLFSATAGQRLNVQLTRRGTASFSTYVYVATAAGMVLTEGALGTTSAANYENFTAPADGDYLLEITSQNLNERGDYTLSLNAAPPGCGYALTPATRRFEASGGAGEVTVTAGMGCAWTATSDASWLTLSNASGTGNSTLRYTVAPNTTQQWRRGTLTLNRQTHVVEQAGAGGTCEPRPLSAGQTISSTLNAADCRSTLRGTPGQGEFFAERFTFTGAAGQQVQFRVTNNSSAYVYLLTAAGAVLAEGARAVPGGAATNANEFFVLPADGAYALEVTTEFSFGGGDYMLSFTTAAGGGGCNYRVTPSASGFDAPGGAGTANVTVASNCAWTAASNATWLSITEGAAGSGNGTVKFSVAANNTTALRRATLTVAGQSLAIEQAGSGGSCAAQMLRPGQTANGTLTGADCRARYLVFQNTDPQPAHLYSFTAQAGEQLSLTARAQAPAGALPLLALVDANGRVLASNTSAFSGAGRLPLTGLFSVPATGTYFVEVAGAVTGTATSYALTLTVAPANCQFVLSDSEFTFENDGGNSSFDVQAGAGCLWTAASAANWISFMGATNGSGNGNVSFSVAANSGAAVRSETISVGGQSVTIRQAGANGNCLPRVLPIGGSLSASFDSGDCAVPPGQSGSQIGDRYTIDFTEGQQFAVVTSGSATNFSALLVLRDEAGAVLAESATSGTPLGRLPQTGFLTLPRTGRYVLTATSLNGQLGAYTIRTETPSSCAYSLAPLTAQSDSEGGMGSLRVASGTGCAWMASVANAPWLSITSGASGMGNGTIAFNLAANATGSARRGTISVSGAGGVGGQSATVEQASTGGNCLPRSLPSNQTVSGTLNAADCNARWPQNFGAQNYYADRYRFTAAAGERAVLLFSSTSQFATPTVTVVDPRGARLQSTQLGAQTSLNLPLAVTGTYELELAVQQNSASGAGVDYRLTLLPLGAGCAYALSAPLQTLEFGGGAGSFEVSAPSGCAWTAVTFDSWLTLTNASGTGNGTVRFTAAANNTVNGRNGTIQVGDRQFTVAQGGVGGNCAVTPLVAGQFVSGTLTSADCRVAISPGSLPGSVTNLLSADRFTFTGRAGEQVSAQFFANNGNGVGLNLLAPDGMSLGRVAAQFSGNINLRLPASGSLTLPGDGVYTVEVSTSITNTTFSFDYQLLLTQTPPQCGYGLAPGGQLFDAAGGASSVQILTTSGCPWTATATASWITFNGAATGNGSGPLNFTVASNNTTSFRTAQLFIAGQLFTIEQAGAGGNCLVQPLPLNQTVNGNLTQGDCRTRVRSTNTGFPADRYSLTVAANQQIRITATGASSSFGPSLFLFDANGAQIAQNAFTNNQSALPAVGFFTLPGAGTYLLEVVSSGGAYTLTNAVTPVACGYGLTAERLTFNATPDGNPTANQTGSARVSTAASCTWTASSNADWLTLTNATGSGTGTLNFSLAPNTTAQLRRATITLADQSITITQGGTGGTCTPVALTPGQVANGQLSPGDCTLMVANSNPVLADQYTFNGRAGERMMLSLTSPESFFGPTLTLFDPNGAQLLQVSGQASNTNALRLPLRGVLLLPLGGTYRVQVATNQQGRYALSVEVQPACTFTITTTALTFEAAGGMGSLPFQTTATCDWALNGNVPWLTTTARGSGAGTATFTVAPNPDATPRTGTLTLGGTNITVTQLARTAIVSAASFSSEELAPESIAAAFGQTLSTTTEAAQTTPLPTRLGNVIVRVRDSAGTTREAPLFAVTPGQINFLIPAGMALGRATIVITNADAPVASGEITLAAVAPGLFTANADGMGVPAGFALRVRNGQQTLEPLARFDQASQRFVAVPLELGPAGDEVFLILFGTGWRNRPAQSAATATLGGEAAEVLFADAQGSLAGLDQLNVRVPRSLAGRGPANLFCTIADKRANVVQVLIR